MLILGIVLGVLYLSFGALMAYWQYRTTDDFSDCTLTCAVMIVLWLTCWLPAFVISAITDIRKQSAATK